MGINRKARPTLDLDDYLKERKQQLRDGFNNLDQNQYDIDDDGKMVGPLEFVETDSMSGDLFYAHLWLQMHIATFRNKMADPVQMMMTGCFLEWLHSHKDRRCATKDDNSLVGYAMYDEDHDEEGRWRRRAKREYLTACRGFWFDCDGESDLSIDEFVAMWPDLEVYVYATYKSTLSEPRWRAYIPTDYAMPGRHNGESRGTVSDLFWVVQRRLIEIVNENGFWSAEEIADGTAPRGARRHGFDAKVYRPEVKIYLPCIPLDEEAAMSRIYKANGRQPIILDDWIENEVDSILTKEFAGHIAEAKRSADIAAGRMILPTYSPMSEAKRNEVIEKHLDIWRSTPAGKGHDAFSSLAWKLMKIGLSYDEIYATLRAESHRSYSKGADRAAEIPNLMRELRPRIDARQHEEYIAGQSSATL